MTISHHKASVSRKIWIWSNSMDGVKDPLQAFDGTVLHVHPDGTVDVIARTHTGAPSYLEKLEVHDPSPEGDDSHYNHHNITMAGSYCTWMPYQKKVMDKEDPPTGTPVVKPAI